MTYSNINTVKGEGVFSEQHRAWTWAENQTSCEFNPIVIIDFPGAPSSWDSLSYVNTTWTYHARSSIIRSINQKQVLNEDYYKQWKHITISLKIVLFECKLHMNVFRFQKLMFHLVCICSVVWKSAFYCKRCFIYHILSADGSRRCPGDPSLIIRRG